MRLCVVSASPEVAVLFQEQRDVILRTAKPGERLPPSDLYIWDADANDEFRRQSVELRSAQHLLLTDARNVESLSDVQSSACVLLKPVTAWTLRAFTELARKSWRLGEQAQEAQHFRSDRDALLQYVLEVNLKLQEYDQERNNFLARALHDFRVPLTALHGYCGLLGEGKAGSVTPPQQEILDSMRESTRRLTRMLSGALELLLEGRSERPPVRVAGDVALVLAAAVREIGPLAKAKEIEVDTEVQSPGGTLLFDQEKMHDVLMNLLENSCKFTPRRGKIRVCAYPERFERVDGDAGAGLYRVDISDSGPGVPADLADKIFEQYVSYAGSSDRSGGGLGLAICRAIVAAHGGRIWTTPSNQGGRFSFVLPMSVPVTEREDEFQDDEALR